MYSSTLYRGLFLLGALAALSILGGCRSKTFVLGGTSNEDSCHVDGATCAEPEDCCSGTCTENQCAPLNEECVTLANPCADNEDCCSGLCTAGLCSDESSYCAQEGDRCEDGEDCCSGGCLRSPPALFGTCAPAPNGPSNCKGIAGTICDDCNECCSRLCTSYGDAGSSICLGATGCRQTGEICRTDAECCGGDLESGLPGAGNVSCEIAEGESVGICRNAISCSPQGNACHYADYACTISAASNRCCDGDGAEGECVLDEQGIPRCSGLGESCQATGEACAMARDCCEGSCAQTAQGQYRCQAP